MRFAPVLPPKLYKGCDHGGYHMVQAHLVDPKNRDFEEWLWERGCGVKAPRRKDTVILDCGTWELGEPDHKNLFRVARIVEPDIIVCPDKFQKSYENLELFRGAAGQCALLADRVMAVPHGLNVEEWCRNADALKTLAEGMGIPICFGVPKILESYLGGRPTALCYLDEYVIDDEEVHLLGIWHELGEAMRVARRFPWVVGVDSSMPYSAAITNRSVYHATYDGAHKVADGAMANEWTLEGWDSDYIADIIHRTRINIACTREAISCRTPLLPYHTHHPLSGIEY